MANLNIAPIAFPWAGRTAILPAQFLQDHGREAEYDARHYDIAMVSWNCFVHS